MPDTCRTARTRWVKRFAAAGFIAFATACLGQDQTRPVLVSVSPPSQSIGVATNQPVAFRFSEAMSTSIAHLDVVFVRAGFPPASLTFQADWSLDRRTLTCQPVPGWPVASTVLWNLGTNLVDLAGNPLATNVVGGFATAAIDDPAGSGTNSTTRFILRRHDAYLQTQAAHPAVAPPPASLFEASVVLASNRTAWLIHVLPPVGSAVSLTADPIAPESWEFSRTAAAPNELEAEFPGGTYAFTREGASGTETDTALLHHDQPPPPMLLNWSEIQEIRVDHPFELSWAAWPGGSVLDTIVVEVGDGLWRTPAPGQPGALAGTVTTVILPPYLLAPESTYLAQVTFHRHHTTTDAPAARTTESQRSTSTHFQLLTAPAPVVPLQLEAPRWINGRFEFDIIGSVAQIVAVETNSTPSTSGWSTALATDLGTGRVTVQLLIPDTRPAIFCRARAIP
jgi:hypothetical protein